MWKYLDRYWKFRSGLRREAEGRRQRFKGHSFSTWAIRPGSSEVRGTRTEVPG